MSVSEFFQEDNGGFSSTRLVMFVWGVGTFVVWVISTANNGWKMQEIDTSIQVILGIVMSGKVAQKFGEQKNPPSAQQQQAAAPIAPQNIPPGV